MINNDEVIYAEFSEIANDLEYQQEALEIAQDFDKALEMLAEIRKREQDKLNFGSDYVHLYFEDVEGDWLENW